MPTQAMPAHAKSAPAKPTRIADLHIHSHYSRATSKDLDFEHLTLWAQLKGVQIVGTGDISHPGWLQEIRDKLEPAEDGLFRLKPELARTVEAEIPAACREPVRFLLAGEISNIYKRADPTARARDRQSDVRKVHNLIYAPSIAAVESIQIALEKIGNIRADGRPILGLDSRDLLEIILEVDERCALIPAHIWTPWFSMLGSKSGFDSVEACFDDLTPHIFALETGLSSDPPMNWRVSNLDGYTLISNSDAHSPAKLAREATLFHCELSYDALFAAMRSGDPAHFGGTLEFFPEEGKYHNDGHRKCGICWEPSETLAHDGQCPVCGKTVTVGVLHRVAVLADRPHGSKPAQTHPFESLIPLSEILSETLGVGPQSKRVRREYHRLLDRLGPELTILRQIPVEEIRKVGGERLAQGIERMRAGHVLVRGGYDGEYGTIKVLDKTLDSALDSAPGAAPGAAPESRTDNHAAGHTSNAEPQLGLFGDDPAALAPALSPQEQPTAGRVREPAPRYTVQDAPQATPEDAPVAAHATGSDDVSPQDMPNGWQPLPLFGKPQNGHEAEQDLGDYDRNTFTPHAAGAFPAESAPNSNGVTQQELWAQLNAEQAAAVQCIDRPLLIVAGPGTGKTHTLTTRIAYLVQGRQAAPETILAITFTNKAAEEMAERLTARLGATLGRRLSVQTFHALGAQLLRDFAEQVTENNTPDYTRDFAIADEQTQDALLAAALPDLPARARARLRARIADAKNRLQTPADFRPADFHPPPESAGPPATPHMSAPDLEFAQHFAAYEAQLRANSLLDYDDLIAHSVRLLQNSPALRAALHARFRWISVDEYQDVNAAQVELLKLLVGPQTNLCAIGDPDQAIYGFRGADYRHFFAFEQDFPGTTIFTLQRNYRSPQSLLTAATQVIVKNPDRMELELRSHMDNPDDNPDHDPVRAAPVQVDVYPAPTDRAEAEYIVHRIEQMVGGTSHFSLDSGRAAGTPGLDDDPPRAFGDFAVLFRLHAQTTLLAQALERSGIPYQIVGGPGLLAHADTRWLAAALHWLHAPQSPVAWTQLCAWDAPPAQAGRLQAEIARRLQTAAIPQDAFAPNANVTSAANETKSPFTASFATRAAWLNRLRQELETPLLPVSETLRRLRDWLQADSSAPNSHFPQLDADRFGQLHRRAQSYGERLPAFLESLALEHEADAYDPRADRVALMTLHAAKGLEFPVVFLAGCEEDLLPYIPSRMQNEEHNPAANNPAENIVAEINPQEETAHEETANEENIEEERRLFYVGLTRAQSRLILTHARRRMLFGRMQTRTLSRFVDDIEATLKALQQPAPRPVSRPGTGEHQLSLF